MRRPFSFSSCGKPVVTESGWIRFGISVKESRGRLSYLTPDRTKPITARKLGTDFDKAAVLAVFQQNAHRAAAKTQNRQEHQPQLSKGIQRTKPAQIAPNPDSPQRLVDIAAKRAEGKGIGYERWAKTFNLKQMAKTMNFLSEHGFTSPEDVDAALEAAISGQHTAGEKLKELESRITANKELMHQIGIYRRTKPAHDGLKTAKKPERYREAFHADLTLYEAAVRYFRERGLKKLPATSRLQAENEALISEKNGLFLWAVYLVGGVHIDQVCFHCVFQGAVDNRMIVNDRIGLHTLQLFPIKCLDMNRFQVAQRNAEISKVRNDPAGAQHVLSA